MIYTPLTKRAMKLCYEKHLGQVDRCGMPYVFHPFHVAESMDDEISACVALLHDVVEDTDTTLEDLEEMGFPPQVVHAVGLLTHDEATAYMDYVRGTLADPIARRVKMADLEHNADLSRLDCVTDADLARHEKYLAALKLLQEAQS